MQEDSKMYIKFGSPKKSSLKLFRGGGVHLVSGKKWVGKGSAEHLVSGGLQKEQLLSKGRGVDRKVVEWEDVDELRDKLPNE